jgi:NAD(P)-dependent dehydrogenase (short-subunit alcohol dehydrogenase family)
LKTIIITGSTRGIGLGLAKNFLELGQRVVISGRTKTAVEQTKNYLEKTYPADQIFGHVADMQEFSQVEGLWNKTREHFGRVDIWINNAGIAQAQAKFWTLTPDQISDLVSTNITGAMYGARVALDGFIQQGRGAFYNMEGLGSDGRRVAGLTLYGTSKRALNYLTDSLAQEVAGTGVIVGAIRPGMVMTDLILKRYQDRAPEEWANAKRIFNILGDRVEDVTPYLADEVFKNDKNGAVISWLTRWKVTWRFLTAGLIKRDIFAGLEGF